MSKIISLFGLILTTTCDAQAVGKYDKAGTETACVAGVIADTCDKDATLKVLKSADTLCASCNGFSAAPAVTTAAGACTACPPFTQSMTTGAITGHFPNAAGTTGCGDCATNCFACTSATVCTGTMNGYYLDSGAPKACVTGDEALCTAHATLKVLKTDASGGADPTVGLCPVTVSGTGSSAVYTGSTLTATPAVNTAEKACHACAKITMGMNAAGTAYKWTAHFPNAAGTSGCGDCADNCDACTSASVCTAASSGYFLKAGTSPAVGVEECTSPGAAQSLCTADATLKIQKGATELCPAGNTLTETPAVDTAEKACQACGLGTTPNAKDVFGCENVAGMCAGNAASATNLNTPKYGSNMAVQPTYEFSCGCPLKMVLKPSASTIELSGADDAARDAVCCEKYVAPTTTTTTTTTAAPASPAAAATKAGPAPGPELGSATSLSLAAGVLIVTAAAFANLM